MQVSITAWLHLPKFRKKACCHALVASSSSPFRSIRDHTLRMTTPHHPEPPQTSETKQNMQAVVFKQYGGPLLVEQVPKPVPKPDEILIQVNSCALNSGDVHVYRGSPWPMRLAFGLFRPSVNILGGSIAGVVAETGSKVTEFAIGDEVVADVSPKFGGFAEYTTVKATMLVKKPKALTMDETSAFGISSTTALQGLELANITKGQSVLVLGASGGVGSFACQLAHHLGCDVTAVVSDAKKDMFQSIKTVSETPKTDKFDIIFDAAGFTPAKTYISILKNPGTYVFAGGSDTEMYNMLLMSSWIGEKGQQFKPYISTANKQNLEKTLGYGIKPIISHTLPLCQVGDAVDMMEQRKVKGKIVIKIK